MPYLDSIERIDPVRETFEGVWNTAILRVSLIELNSDHAIPNGELIFSSEVVEDDARVLYQEGPLRIEEVISSTPFALLDQLLEGELRTSEGAVDVDLGLYDHTPSETFSGSARSDVHEKRPMEEFNAIIEPKVRDDLIDEYTSVAKGLQDRLQRAEEPYYAVSRAENFYFEHRFSKNSERPRILVFAHPGIEAQVDEDMQFRLRFPEVLQEKLAIRVLPQRPYGEFKGRSIDLKQDEIQADGDGSLEFTTKLPLQGVERAYVLTFVEDELVRHIDHRLPAGQVENDRFRVLDAYDQKGNLLRYLSGQDPNQFEKAVLNVLSTAGYLVQWFGEDSFDIPNWSDDVPAPAHKEIDLIAYAPDGSVVLFIECTHRELSAKEQIVDRAEEISGVLSSEFIESDVGIQAVQLTPCIATSRREEEIPDDVLQNFEERDVKVLYQERLRAILDGSRSTDGRTSIATEFIDVM